MARVYQDKDRRRGTRKPWMIDYVGVDGKRHRDVTTATNRLQAEALLRQKLDEITKAQILGLSNEKGLSGMSFAKFVKEEYIPFVEKTLRPTTARFYRVTLQKFIPVIGQKKIASIASSDIQRCIDQALMWGSQRDESQRLKPGTINSYRTIISCALEQAKVRGYVQKNAAREVPYLKADNKRDRWLRPHETDRLLHFLPDWVRPLAQIALNTGMRVSEVCDMKWANLDFDQRQIRIPHGKNHQTRYVPMNLIVIAAVENARPFVGPGGNSPYVFANSDHDGKPYTISGVGKAFKRACRKAGIDGATFHTLRHTFVSILVQRGVPERVIRRIVGHSSSQMTDRYAHLAPENMKDAIDLLTARDKAENASRQAR